MKNETRYVEDLGINCLDLPSYNPTLPYDPERRGTCLPDAACMGRCEGVSACYNVKLYRLYPGMVAKDQRNLEYWQIVPVKMLARHVKARTRSLNLKRFRFASRGDVLTEAWSIQKVAELAKALPDVDFWVPTMGWRYKALLNVIREKLEPLENVKLAASITPATNPKQLATALWLMCKGWNIMFYGDDKDTPLFPRGAFFKCPKTWNKQRGACATCDAKDGCFGSGNAIWLKQH